MSDKITVILRAELPIDLLNSANINPNNDEDVIREARRHVWLPVGVEYSVSVERNEKPAVDSEQTQDVADTSTQPPADEAQPESEPTKTEPEQPSTTA